MAKILFVEDDQLLQEIYRDKLVREGYDVVTVTNGKDALQQAQSFHPDLILLDIMLPGGMNGFDIMRELSTKPDLKKVPIIVMSNLDSERDTALSMGARDYILKAETPIEDVMKKVKTHSKKGLFG